MRCDNYEMKHNMKMKRFNVNKTSTEQKQTFSMNWVVNDPNSCKRRSNSIYKCIGFAITLLILKKYFLEKNFFVHF